MVTRFTVITMVNMVTLLIMVIYFAVLTNKRGILNPPKLTGIRGMHGLIFIFLQEL
jgi:hypothetical protein